METASEPAAPDSGVNRDNPWPGLASFTEELSGFFFGREKETEELVRLVRRQTLTVLFGQSGLGKSSLLQAGAFPLLRAADYLPLYLRLDHELAAPALADQIKAALVAAFQAAGADAPAPRADESLWEYFHRKDIDIWSAKNRLLTPVLAFDQFEEIFTLGRADEARRDRGRAFLSELADLVENRPPAALRAKFDAGELDPARYNFDKPSCQVILSLREDFLPDLEGLKGEMRSILHNRMRVRRLNGTQALEIVSRPAPQLLAEGVAEKIVEFVAGARGGSAARLAELEVEPSLLSVICRELNQRRRARGQAQITADLVSGNRREILHDFYERSVADLPAVMREFVEDRLLTKSGFRENLALETALEAPGVTRPLIDTLVARRLLRIEERVGVQRVELTHDVLAEVIRASRDSRQQRLALAQARADERHTRRRLWLLRGIAAVLLVLLAGVSWAAWRAVRSERLEAQRSSRTDFLLASRLFDEGKAGEGIAYLVRAAHEDPLNPAVGSRLVSAIAARNYLLPEGAPTRLAAAVKWMELSGDGTRLFILSEDGVVSVLDAATGAVVHEFPFVPKAVGLTLAPADGGIFAVQREDDSLVVCDAATGRPRFPALRPARKLNSYTRAILSPDGRWLAAAAENGFWLWDAATGAERGSRSLPGQVVGGFCFSGNGQILATSDMASNRVEAWSIPSCAPAGPRLPPGEGFFGSGVSPDGRWVAISGNKLTRIFEVATGTEAGPSLETQNAFAVLFTPDSKRLITADFSHVVNVWDVATGKRALPPLVQDGYFGQDGVEVSRDGRTLLARSSDGYSRLWDLTTGRLLGEPALQQEARPTSVLGSSGRQMFVGTSGGLVFRLDLAQRAAEPLVLPYGSEFLEAKFVQDAPDRIRVLFRGRLVMVDAKSGREIDGGCSLPERITNARVMRDDGAYLAVRTESGRNQVWAVAPGTVRVVPLVDVPAWQPWFQFSERGDLVSMAAINGSQARIWNLRTGQPVGSPISCGTAFYNSSSNFSPDGKWFAIGAAGRAMVWEVGASRMAFELKPLPFEEIDFAKFSPDGSRIATGSLSGEARIWDVSTRRPVTPAFHQRVSFRSMIFSPDGRTLFTGTFGGVAQAWNAQDGQPVGQAEVHADLLNQEIVTDDGARLITSSRDGTARLWDARTGLELAEPMRIVGRGGFSRSSLGPNGENLVCSYGGNGQALVWAIPPATGGNPTPEWLLQLATICSGKRVANDGTLADAGAEFDRIESVRREVAALPDQAPFATWGKWILSDPATRPVAPGLAVTAAEAHRLAAEIAARAK